MALKKEGILEADVLLYLALEGFTVPLHLLPALAHTLLPLLGLEAQ